MSKSNRQERRETMSNFNWQEYKAQVALQVIGYYVKIYESRQGNMVTDAQAQAVEAAAELAEKMERRLKQ